MKSENLSLKVIIKEFDFQGKQLLLNETLEKKKKDLLLLANRLVEKIRDPCNAKEHYQSFIRKKNTK